MSAAARRLPPSCKRWPPTSGLDDARTLLQGGNLVFRSAGPAPNWRPRWSGRSPRVSASPRTCWFEVPGRSGVPPSRPTRTTRWPSATPEHLVVMALKSAPSPDAVAALQAANQGREIIAAVGRELFIAYPDGIGDLQARRRRRRAPPLRRARHGAQLEHRDQAGRDARRRANGPCPQLIQSDQLSGDVRDRTAIRRRPPADPRRSAVLEPGGGAGGSARCASRARRQSPRRPRR